MVDLVRYRQQPREQQRTASLLRMVEHGRSVLDVGARDGYISRLLTRQFDCVTALDLVPPPFNIDRVHRAAGDVTALGFADDSFDAVVCAEVLEHIPPAGLECACRELVRVARRTVLIGVPYRQDTRIGRTTCVRCGARNPPWGHVNTFDEHRLARLFRPLRVERVQFIGSTRTATTAVAAALMDVARNPWGTYAQEEPCIACGAALVPPLARTAVQRAAGRAAVTLNDWQCAFVSPRPAWIHMRFAKNSR